MLQRLRVFPLALVLLLAPIGSLARADDSTLGAKREEQAAQIKAEVAKRVANGKKKVTVNLRNGQKIKGRLIQANKEQFTILANKTMQPMEVAYSEVDKVKGVGLSSGAKIGIIAAVVVGVAAIVIVKGLQDLGHFGNGPILR